MAEDIICRRSASFLSPNTLIEYESIHISYFKSFVKKLRRSAISRHYRRGFAMAFSSSDSVSYFTLSPSETMKSIPTSERR